MASDDLSSKNLKQAISSKISELEALTRAAGDSVSFLSSPFTTWLTLADIGS